MNIETNQDAGASLSELFLRDLAEFEDEVEQDETLGKREERDFDQGDMEEEKPLDPAIYKEYENKDTIGIERSKLVESELFQKVEGYLEGRTSIAAAADIVGYTQPTTFEIVMDCNQLIGQIDQQ